jgi:tRNA1Val (adenine37-N6)-methyltransferase
VVLPESTGNTFIGIAQEIGWTCVCVPIFRIRKATAAPRAAGALAERGECFNDRMVIRGPDQRYSEDYTALTQAFYLFM